MKKTSNSCYIIKLSAILFAICFISTLLLTLCNYLTKDKIAMLEIETAKKGMQEIIPNAEFEEIDTTEFDKELTSQLDKLEFVSAYKATLNGEFAGYCITVSPNGFGGAINMIVGVKPDNESFHGIKIVSLSETPGLGAKATEKSFYGQFSKNKRGVLETVKNSPAPAENQINAISGATITSSAVTDGANNAREIAIILSSEEAE